MTEVEIFKQSLDVSRIMMVITILMAVTTAVFSALTMAFERSHNKRSIKPYCSLYREVSAGKVSYLLKNAGLGPMVVSSVRVTDGRDRALDFEVWVQGLREKGIEAGQFLRLRNEVAIGANDAKVLLEFPASRMEAFEREAALCRGISVSYSDIYSQKYSADLSI